MDPNPSAKLAKLAKLVSTCVNVRCEYQVASILLELYGLEFAWVKEKDWDEKYYLLRHKISTYVYDAFIAAGRSRAHKAAKKGSIGSDAASRQVSAQTLLLIAINLRDTDFKDRVMEEAKELFFVGNIKNATVKQIVVPRN